MHPVGRSFTLKFPSRVKHLVTDIGVSLPSMGKGPGGNNVSSCKTLWDTGASICAIDEKFAAHLGLVAVSQTKTNHAAGNSIVNVYLVDLYLPNHVLIENVQVLEAKLTGCSMLIGMDIISMGDFAVTNQNNSTTFSFRVPSLAEIDFVKDDHENVEKNGFVGASRNKPCPCGSGKNYKNCHGTK
ncbi:MAG: SEC-C metal-binding domain-containing protein [Saprospiraceae bacterium]